MSELDFFQKATSLSIFVWLKTEKKSKSQKVILYLNISLIWKCLTWKKYKKKNQHFSALLFRYIFILWFFTKKIIYGLNVDFNARLYISHSVQNSSRLGNFTLDVIDFTEAKILINKRVWLKICLLEFIIHLATVLYMYSFVTICTRLCVIVVFQLISSSTAHQLECCAACEVPFDAKLSWLLKKWHCTQLPILLVESLAAFYQTRYPEYITSSISQAFRQFTIHLQSFIPTM